MNGSCKCYITLRWNGLTVTKTNLLGQFVSYEENGVLQIRYLGSYSQHFIFFVTHEWVLYAKALHYTRIENLAGTNTLAYWADW